MPHTNINPKTRKRAQSLRREMTKAERIMWDMLRDLKRRGAHFRREAPVGPYVADFAWLSAKIIVEVDGDSHEGEEARQHDQARTAFLNKQGFNVLRFDNLDVINARDHVYFQLETALSPHLTPGVSETEAKDDCATRRKDRQS